jgi:hypothetical protein
MRGVSMPHCTFLRTPNGQITLIFDVIEKFEKYAPLTVTQLSMMVN